MPYIDILCTVWERHYIPEDPVVDELRSKEDIFNYLQDYGIIDDSEILYDTITPYNDVLRAGRNVVELYNDEGDILYESD